MASFLAGLACGTFWTTLGSFRCSCFLHTSSTVLGAVIVSRFLIKHSARRPHPHDFLEDLEPVFKHALNSVIRRLSDVIQSIGKVLVDLEPLLMQEFSHDVASVVQIVILSTLEE